MTLITGHENRRSAKNYLDLVSLAVACYRNDAAFDLISVDCELLDALANVDRKSVV